MNNNTEKDILDEIKSEHEVEKNLVSHFTMSEEFLNKNKPLLKLTGVTKKFGSVVAVRNVSFEIRKGERVGIIGANGSGKTTISEIIAGLTEITSGEVDYGFNILISRWHEMHNERTKYKNLKRSIKNIERIQLKKYTADVKKVNKSAKVSISADLDKLNNSKVSDLAENAADIELLKKNYADIIAKLKKEKELAKEQYKKDLEEYKKSAKTHEDKYKLAVSKKNISYRHGDVKIRMDNLNSQKRRHAERVFRYTRFFETLNKNRIEKYRESDTYKNSFAEFKRLDALIKDLGFIKVPQEKMGMQFQDSIYPSGLSLKNIIRFAIRLHKLPISEEEVLKMLETFQMEDFYKRDGRSLSGGQRQKLNIFLALLHSPELIIMDEISTGLDLSAREEIIKFVNKILKEKKIASILISHHMDEIEQLCDRIIVFDNGSIERDTTLAEIKKEFGSLAEFMRWIIQKGNQDRKDANTQTLSVGKKEVVE